MNLFNLLGKKERIFLDYASTTPIDKEVVRVMREYEEKIFANPSALYSQAITAKENLEKARRKVAEILSTQSKSIYFTSGGTEGNNMTILGVFEKSKSFISRPHFITSQIEHPSVLEVFSEIEKRGGEVTKLSVNSEGLVSIKDIRDAIKKETVLVSIMYANNEIGTIQPIKEISKVIKDFRIKNNTEYPYFHTDACQAPLYLDVNVLKLGVDMMTLDGIKIYGPRSTGVLFVKNGVEISPIIFGGGQEGGLRSGTENVSSAIGFAKALEIAEKMKESESTRLKEIRDYEIEKILNTFPKTSLNGSKEERLPNNINICFPGLDAEFGVISLDVAGISASYSSSCRTLKEDSSSYVVEALGKEECKMSSLRFTLGRESTKRDIDELVSVLKKIFK
ncbi:MAG: cysteine desulfurase family protein [Minisyncoccia bacterium]